MLRKQKIQPGQIWTRKEDEFLRNSVQVCQVGKRRVVVQQTCHNGRLIDAQFAPEYEIDIRLLRDRYSYDFARTVYYVKD